MCTLKCVSIAYRRAPWFRLLREPLLMGMRIYSAVHHIKAEAIDYPFPTLACRGCIRFYKTLLFRRSASFRWLHRRINPVFDYFLYRIVTGEEKKKARDYALAASAGRLSNEEIDDWMKGIKTGL